MSETTFLKSNLAIYILWIVSFIVATSIFIYFGITISMFKDPKVVSNGDHVTFAKYNDTLNPIDEIISTSLPYYKYKELNDSINWVRLFKNGSFQSAVLSPFGGAMSDKFIMDKDIVHVRKLDISLIEAPEKYFYIIKGWKMKSNEHPFSGDYTYYVKNGVPYFRKYVLKSTKGKHSNFEMTEKKLNYFCDRDNKTILIPISKNAYTFAKYNSLFLMFVFVFVFLLCVLLAFKILYNISRGKVFIEENIKMFRQATFITILTPLLFILIVLSYRLLFYTYFDVNVVLNMDFFKDRMKMLLVGVVVSILYGVFKRGFNIQQENDLVV